MTNSNLTFDTKPFYEEVIRHFPDAKVEARTIRGGYEVIISVRVDGQTVCNLVDITFKEALSVYKVKDLAHAGMESLARFIIQEGITWKLTWIKKVCWSIDHG